MVPMRNLGWTVMAVSLFYLPFAAQAQFKSVDKGMVVAQAGFNGSIRRPAAEAPATTAQAQAQAAPPVFNVPTPVVNVAPGPAPVVNVSPLPPSLMAEVQSWIQTSLLGLVALFLGKLGFKSAPVPVASAGAADGLPEQASVLLKLRDKVTDPDTRAKIDAALLAAVGTGIPSTLVRTGLGAIPVAGPLVSGLEPLLQEAFTGFLKSRLETNTTRLPNA